MGNGRQKVIIDSDMGWDDVLSILYLMKCPDIEIVGVAVTGCGETDLRWGAIIAKTLMEIGSQVQAVVSVGTSTPMLYRHLFPQPFKDDMNDIMGLLGSLNPELCVNVDDRPAWSFMAETLDHAKEDVVILSLGGFTNLATMLELHPQARIDRISQIYAMAGAVWVDGNIAALNGAQKEWDQGALYSTNHVAEWNVFVDPLAAKRVFDSPIPMTLVPLDACNYVLLDPSYVKTITATDVIATLAKNIFHKKTGDSNEGIPVPIFDPLATMIMAGGMQCCQTHAGYLDVNVTDSEINNQCGKTSVVDSGSRKITIVQGVSQRAFADKFAAVINAPMPR